MILRYARGPRWTFNADAVRIPYTASGIERKDDSAWGRHEGASKVYRPHAAGKVPEDWWDIVPLNANAPERVGYPTQKPLALLDRIIAASSNPGDVVLDPFCGCATACISAQALHREWVGIDISPKAAELVRQRMRDELRLFYHGTHRTDVPQRTDLGPLPKHNCAANRTALYGEQGGHCAGCAAHFEPRHLEVDHIIARAKGGTDHLSNLQLLCGACNRTKGDRGMEYLRSKLRLTAA